MQRVAGVRTKKLLRALRGRPTPFPEKVVYPSLTRSLTSSSSKRVFCNMRRIRLSGEEETTQVFACSS
jgi:hypothetical protein